MRPAHQGQPGGVLSRDERREEGLQDQRGGACAPPLFGDIEGKIPALSHLRGKPQPCRSDFIPFHMGITGVPAGIDTGKVLRLQAALRPSPSDIDDLYRLGQYDGEGKGAPQDLSPTLTMTSIYGNIGNWHDLYFSIS